MRRGEDPVAFNAKAGKQIHPHLPKVKVIVKKSEKEALVADKGLDLIKEISRYAKDSKPAAD